MRGGADRKPGFAVPGLYEGTEVWLRASCPNCAGKRNDARVGLHHLTSLPCLLERALSQQAAVLPAVVHHVATTDSMAIKGGCVASDSCAQR